MLSTIKNVTLKMWEKKMLPSTSMVEGKRVKTGGQDELTSYVFTDEFGTKLVFLSKNSDYRQLEGHTGELQVELSHDEFTKRNRVAMKSFLV